MFDSPVFCLFDRACWDSAGNLKGGSFNASTATATRERIFDVGLWGGFRGTATDDAWHCRVSAWGWPDPVSSSLRGMIGERRGR